MIVLISGYPLSGKSTLARHLQERFARYHPVYLGTDEVRAELGLDKRQKAAAGNVLIDEQSRRDEERVYGEIETRTLDILKDPKALLIVGGTYREAEKRRRIREIAESTQNKSALIKLTCDDSVLVRNLAKAGGNRAKSNAGTKVHRVVKLTFQHPTQEEIARFNTYYEITNPLEIPNHLGEIASGIESLLQS
jgi:predicted kinase